MKYKPRKPGDIRGGQERFITGGGGGGIGTKGNQTKAHKKPKSGRTKISSTEYSAGDKFIIQKADNTWSVYDKSTLDPNFDLAKELSIRHKTIRSAQHTISLLKRRKILK